MDTLNEAIAMSEEKHVRLGVTLSGQGRIPLISNELTPPFDEAAIAIDTISLNFAGRVFSQEELVAIGLIQIWFCITAHWFCKRLNRSYKIPYKPSTAREYECWGDLFLSIFNLCIELHSLEYQTFGCKYKNAIEWFQAILNEYSLDLMTNMLSESGGKKSSIQENTRLANLYRCKENPHDPIQQPHQYALAEASLSALEKFPDRIKPLWNSTKKSKRGLPLVQAHYAVNRNWRKNTNQVLKISNGKIVSIKNGGFKKKIADIPLTSAF